jgi:hypothetical protein
MFRDQLDRRYAQRWVQEFKYMVPIVSTQLNPISLIVWTCVGVGLIGFTILGCLYCFQVAERRRYKNHEIVIDVDASIDY